MELEKRNYPIGKFESPGDFDESKIKDWITVIKDFPVKIKGLTKDLSDSQLDTPYRENGWTVRQVVHHCADSHMNAFIRFKLSLTEDKPVIKPYREDLWAELSDTRQLEIQPSVSMIEGLHFRWGIVLDNMQADDFHKVFIHPEHGTEINLYTALAMYDWHCRHHLGHIQQTL